jgi:hypothetical protein
MKIAFLLLLVASRDTEDPEDDIVNDRTLREQLNDFAARNSRVRRGGDSHVNFTIVSITPNEVPSTGDTHVTIILDDLHSHDVFYCRFDTIVVLAESVVFADKEIRCRAPKHQQGDFSLAVSPDQLTWSQDVPFVYYDSSKAIPLVIAIIIGVSFISFAMFIFQMRQCQNEQRKHRKAPAALASGYMMNKDDDHGSLKRKSSRIL